MSMRDLENELIKDVVEEAGFAFWDVVVRRFPLAHNGDLSVERTISFEMIATEAVEEWVNNNVEIPLGYRFSLRRDVGRYPDFVAKQGMTGTVTRVQDDGLIAAKMDDHLAGAEQWQNELWWETGPAAFLDDSVPLEPGS